MTTMMVIWSIVLTANTGHRLDVPGEYFTEKECVAAAQHMSQTTRGTASCVSRTASLPEPTTVAVPAAAREQR